MLILLVKERLPLWLDRQNQEMQTETERQRCSTNPRVFALMRSINLSSFVMVGITKSNEFHAKVLLLAILF